VILFDPESGAPVCVVHAGEITAIRTAAASAVATDALARKDARRLALLGYGEQAATHARAIGKVRDIESIVFGDGRTIEREPSPNGCKRNLACQPAAAASVKDAVAKADIVCTVTTASEPILKGEWVRPGTHLNLVGSGWPGRWRWTTTWSSARDSLPTAGGRSKPRRGVSSGQGSESYR